MGSNAYFFVGSFLVSLLAWAQSQMHQFGPPQQYGGGGISQLPGPLASCQAEIQYFCPGPLPYHPPEMMACLKMNYAGLSSDCQQAVTTAMNQYLPPDPVTGANCQTDAQVLCSGIQQMHFIMNCLRGYLQTNASMLSKGCRHNLMNSKPLDRSDLIPDKFIEAEAKHLTRVITALAIIWLAVPLVFSFWAFIQSLNFYHDWNISNYNHLRKRLRRKMKHPRIRKTKVEAKQDFPSVLAQIPEEAEEDTPAQAIEDALASPPCSIGFSSLSFWVQLPRNWRRPFAKPVEKRILSEAVGFFEPGSLTAVMGPSGSGKSTLLRLIGGRSYNGRYEGSRYLNGISYGTSDYESIIRKQGFVYQSDSHFEKLTVWETLAFQAALRLPNDMPLSQKLERVQQVMVELGIESAASAQIGGPSIQGISGGQQRRLSIAVQLLCLPSVLFLDEPTSGLDATTSLKLVSTLHQLTQIRKTTIIMTIHQPRNEIFELFDQILLMGVGGNVGFCGPTAMAVEFISGLSIVSLSPSTYDNPSDFIIDAMGISSDEESMEGALQNIVRDDKELSLTMSKDFRNTPQFQHLENQMHEDCHNLPLLQASFKSLGFFKQTWILFSRKMRRLTVDPFPILSSYFQIIGVSWVVSFSFSYETSNPLEVPYKVTMLLVLIVAYAMTLPYLVLSIEQMEERSSVKSEALTGVANYPAYVFSTFLIETPRAVVQSALLVGMVYSFHDLNTDVTNVTFCVVGLMVGVSAMQAVITLCGAITDKIQHTYTMAFLCLGGGALFGGILVKLEKIPWLFRWVYYISVPALTQRALVVNDLLCCYLTTTCEDLAQQILPQNAEGPGHGPPVCPPDLQITGDGTERGNLGRLALRVLGLDKVDNYVELLTLFCAAVACRFLAYAVLRFRAWYEDRLMNKEEKTDGLKSLCSGLVKSSRMSRSMPNRNHQYRRVDSSEEGPATNGRDIEMLSLNVENSNDKEHNAELN